jgi:hypothetical protein
MAIKIDTRLLLHRHNAAPGEHRSRLNKFDRPHRKSDHFTGEG